MKIVSDAEILGLFTVTVSYWIIIIILGLYLKYNSRREQEFKKFLK